MTDVSRRAFVVGAVVTLAGCANKTSLSLPEQSSDLAAVRLVVGLENLAAQTSQQIEDANAAGQYGKLPQSILGFVQRVRAHHVDHAKALNDQLQRDNQPAVTGIDTAYNSEVVAKASEAARDVSGVLRLIIEIEDVLTATGQTALSVLTDAKYRDVLARIHPANAQHATVARLLLGEYPTPSAFASAALARGVADQIG